MTRSLRVRKVSLAALIGWLAGFAATIPFELLEVTRNASGDWKLLVASLGLGLMIWAMWTLGMAAAGWAIAGLPVALLVRPADLIRHPARIILLSALVGLGVVAVKFRVWHFELALADYLAVRLYAVFLSVFSSITAWRYIVSLRRAGKVRITVPA